MKVANPQGKGLVAVFKDWHSPMVIRQQRDLPSLVRDYVLSLLVLSAEFKFKPIAGKDYFLYLANNLLRMSMIEPEKAGTRFGTYVASCSLQAELTWRVTFDPQSQRDPELQRFMQQFFAGFEQHHQQATSLLQLLPFFQESLPFYARMYANGLAKSIAHGLEQLDIANIAANELLTIANVSYQALTHRAEGSPKLQ